ncbi:MAG: asparaginase, partial [Pseudomonadota bacterium]|nr:asparaginase [Pseudomonadota bacterium]
MLFPSLPFLDEAPLTIDIRRGNGIESSHLVDIAVVDCVGRIILGYGDTERTVFPRSAMKPLQAIALIEELQNKGLEADLSDELICVTCASHNGQPAHLKAVGELLSLFGIAHDYLACGAHWSLDQVSLIEQVRSVSKPSRLHNNCSGKHA